MAAPLASLIGDVLLFGSCTSPEPGAGTGRRPLTRTPGPPAADISTTDISAGMDFIRAIRLSPPLILSYHEQACLIRASIEQHVPFVKMRDCRRRSGSRDTLPPTLVSTFNQKPHRR
jgi:hypothetical protein